MIEADRLTKRFSGGVEAVRSVSFQVAEGGTLALIGPSGCGKTTTLKMLNRLYEPTDGRVSILGKDILLQDPVAVRRQIGYVIQGGGLFPHWTVEQNIATVPGLLGWPEQRVSRRVAELMQLLDLDPSSYRSRYPAELSGGQRQRVGIARALAADPPVMLLDEPFSALDPITRGQIQQEFLRLRTTLGKTMVFVTHDLAEAFLLADQVLLMDRGSVQQIGTPDELKLSPVNEFVELFLAAEMA